MLLHLLLCCAQGNLFMNCETWRIIFIDGYSCLPGWDTCIFLQPHFVSLCVYVQVVLKLLLITLNTVEPTSTCILHGLGSWCFGQLSRSPTTSDTDNNSMAILLDVNWYCPYQKGGIEVSGYPYM